MLTHYYTYHEKLRHCFWKASIHWKDEHESIQSLTFQTRHSADSIVGVRSCFQTNFVNGFCLGELVIKRVISSLALYNWMKKYNFYFCKFTAISFSILLNDFLFVAILTKSEYALFLLTIVWLTLQKESTERIKKSWIWTLIVRKERKRLLPDY